MSEPDPSQPDLPLPFPDLAGDMPLLPARMVNEYLIVDRLFRGESRGLIEAGRASKGVSARRSFCSAANVAASWKRRVRRAACSASLELIVARSSDKSATCVLQWQGTVPT